MNQANNNIIALGETTFRGAAKKFGIKLDDRRRHVYIIGKTGMGKTELLINMAVQDIRAGHGLAFIDPHGENADRLLDFIPEERIQDVIYFNPSDTEHPIAFNVMEKVAPEFRHLVASGMMQVFKKLWPDVWSPRMEYILNNAILALLEIPDSTLLGVNRMFSDPAFRKEVVAQLKDPVIKSFWITEYGRYTDRFAVEATAAIQNKVGQFISNPLIRNIIGQVHSSIDMRKAMDSGKILLANVSKGKIGEDNSRLLGALLITKLQLAAMSRVDVAEYERRDFYLYVDEFQSFATESFASILSEARKYRLGLTLAHQYIAQMEEVVRDAAFGNVGTLICFRVGAEDAEFLEKEFAPEIMATDLVNLAKFNIYTKLMIDGVTSRAFSAQTLPPPATPGQNFREQIIEQSQAKYGTVKEQVAQYIEEWSGMNQLETSVAMAVETKKKKKQFKPSPSQKIQEKAALFELFKEQQKMETSADPTQTKAENLSFEQKDKPKIISDQAQEPPKTVSSLEFIQKKSQQLKPKGQANLAELRAVLDQALDAKHEQSVKAESANQEKVDEKEKGTQKAENKEPQKFVSLKELLPRQETLKENKYDNNDNDDANTNAKKRHSGVLKPGQSVKFD